MSEGGEVHEKTLGVTRIEKAISSGGERKRAVEDVEEGYRGVWLLYRSN